MIVPSLRGGGLERVATDLTLTLTARGWTVEVFVISGLGVYADTLRGAGVPVHDVQEGRMRIRGIPLRLIAALRRFGPDLIHAHSGTWYPSAVAARVLRRPRLVFTDHGRYPPEPRGRAILERWCLRRTDRLLAVSEPTATYVKNFLGLDFLPTVIENGIDLAPYRRVPAAARAELRRSWNIGERDLLLLALGRLAPVKNHEGMLAALAQARRRAPRLKLAIVGKGPLEGALRAQSAAAGLDDAVRFLGYRTDAPPCLSASDVVLFASTTEGLPIALLESLAAGRPLIVTNVGGMPAALGEPPAGLIVPPADVPALADAMARLSEEKGLWESLAARTDARAERYDLSVCTARHEEIYRSVLQGR